MCQRGVYRAICDVHDFRILDGGISVRFFFDRKVVKRIYFDFVFCLIIDPVTCTRCWVFTANLKTGTEDCVIIDEDYPK